MDPKDYYKDKIILVTGGVGSIGSHLIRELLLLEPKSIRIFDNNETGLFDLESDLNSPKIRSFIGDIRDKDRLMMAFDRVDIVFHAAALKHVPLCEFNPFDAIKTNVLGTQNIIEAAIANNVKKVINVSTDKAVSPSNVMGATKLLAERLVVSAKYYRGFKSTIFANVRFGNVLNSRGSVIPIFKKQINQGGPVTITDPEMTRFFMDIPAAADLIIKSCILANGGETFILKMPVIKISDLATCMIEEYAPASGYVPSNIAIKEIGKRSGEKLFEELMTDIESSNAYENDEMFVILPYKYFDEDKLVKVPEGFKKVKLQNYSSENEKCLSKGKIRKMIKDL